MPGGTYDLNGKKISATYHRVVQYESGSTVLYDGRGDSISSLTISGSQVISGNLDMIGTASADYFVGDGSGITGVISASYALSSSVEIEHETSSSFADFATSASSAEWASVATSASHAGFTTSASYANTYDELWTGSDGYVSRLSDVKISGSLFVSKSGGDELLQIGDDYMFVSGNGFVGIGVIDPDEILTVSGNIHVVGYVHVDGISCCLGEMYISASETATIIGAQNTWYQINSADWIGGLTGSSVHYSGSTLENDHAGYFVVAWDASLVAETINDTFQVGLSINDAIPDPKTIVERKFGNNDIGTMSGRAFLELVKDDLVSLKAYNVGGTGNITVRFANVNYRRM